MPDISKIQLPGSGGVYNIKDAVARAMISGGVSFIVAWDGTSVPDISEIPAGIVVRYNNRNYTGLLSADDESVQSGAFYLVKSTTAVDSNDVYDEYVPIGASGSRTWEKIGDTQVNLTDVVKNVTLNKSTDSVLGADTTFTNSNSNVSFSGGTTANVLGANTTFTTGNSNVTFTGGSTSNVLGEDTTFTTTVTPSTTFLGASTTDGDFVTSVTANTGTVPNVTENTDVEVPYITANNSVVANKSNWTFNMGEGNAAETLIISGGNGTDVSATFTTLGQAKTASKVTLGTEKTIVTGITIGETAKALTSVNLMSNASDGTGRVRVTTGINTATTTAVTTGADSDIVAAITNVGTGTAAPQVISVGSNDRQTVVKTVGTATAEAQTITVGTNDTVTALTDDTSVTVIKGNQ